MNCICEFVETNRSEIRSGWRPLFGALRLASVGQTDSVESAPVLEVFRVFLTTDNTLVFANAALDCILCLLRHVRGIGEPEVPITVTQVQQNSTIINDSLSSPLEKSSEEENRQTRFCLESLKYLLSCSAILSSMYKMPSCPMFHSAQRIQVASALQYVDPVIPNLEVARFDRKSESGLQDVVPEVSYELLSIANDAKVVTLQSMERPSGVLKVWYILIEGLASATMICPKKYQPYTLETLFHLLRNTFDTPGPLFALHCVNHLLLPMVQNWLRKTSKISRGWETFAPNFKQCCGMTTDLVVDFVERLQGTQLKISLRFF